MRVDRINTPPPPKKKKLGKNSRMEANVFFFANSI